MGTVQVRGERIRPGNPGHQVIKRGLAIEGGQFHLGIGKVLAVPLVAGVGIVMLLMPAGERVLRHPVGFGSVVRVPTAARVCIRGFVRHGFSGPLDRIAGGVPAGVLVMPTAPQHRVRSRRQEGHH